jgi:hypothetical protein
VAAVEAAGIEIDNDDYRRQRIADTGLRVQLSARGVLRLIAESKWRWPEEWDERQAEKRRTRVRVRRGGFVEYILKPEALKPGDEVLPWPDEEERWV